jgi:hypothetical protein
MMQRTGSAGDALTHRSENQDLLTRDLLMRDSFIQRDARLFDRVAVRREPALLDWDGE